MEDQGFEFRPPAEKRAPNAFEPPPWEREAFEEMQRRRAAEDARAAATPESRPEEPTAEERPARQANGSGETDVGPDAADDAEGGVPESVVLEMMAGLAAEEPKATEAYAGVALGTGLFLTALGSVLVVWAMAALVGSGTTGWIGQLTGTGLGLFGLFFFGMGVWLVHRTLKQRGVL